MKATLDQESREPVKCVVWDLDDTLWSGVLLEGDALRVRPEIPAIVRALDERGILQSVASKNDHEAAMAKLRDVGLAEYFIHPQVSWNAKSSSIRVIAERLNIGLDTFAFVDDQPFERDEVSSELPQVRCIDSARLEGFLEREDMIPRFVTDDAKHRRRMYLADIDRKTSEDTFVGPKEEFLASLDLRFVIADAGEEDLQRAEELTVRTNQLNATGYTYSYEELAAFVRSPAHRLWIAGLDDRYGTYGRIGVALVHTTKTVWTLKLLLMSCRVMSRGVGTIMLNHVMQEAKKAGVALHAEFVPTDRNRMMYITYKFAGFSELETVDGVVTLVNDLANVQPHPPYVKVDVQSAPRPEQG